MIYLFLLKYVYISLKIHQSNVNSHWTLREAIQVYGQNTRNQLWHTALSYSKPNYIKLTMTNTGFATDYFTEWLVSAQLRHQAY